jgi:hypothetical protein
MKTTPCIAALLCMLPLAWVCGQSNTVGTIAYDPALYADGYTLIYPHNQPHARLIDACGEVVHMWTNDSLRRPGNSAYLTPMGSLIWAHRPANFQGDAIWAGGGGAVIEGRSWNNNIQWNYTLNDSTGRLHHDFALTNAGTVLAIAWERIDSIAAVEAGRDPELLEDGELWSERIIELLPNESGGADVIWEWRVWDHLVQDFDSTKANFGVPEFAPQRVNLNFGSPSSAAPDWLHINSIDYNPALDHILLSVPTFDELWIIDKGAPNGGLIWRWGNPEAYDRGTSEDQLLHYQHAARWLDAPYHQGSPDFGKIAVFNNRNPGPTGPYSSAHLIAPELIETEAYTAYMMNTINDTATYAPVDFDWNWTAPNPTDFFSSGLSNFERLPNGNNLILSGRTGEIYEFTATGDTAWYYRVPLQGGTTIAQGTELGMNDNLLFRATRYPAQFPVFNSVDLTPMGAWELDPAPLLVCQPCTLSATLNIEPGAASVDVAGANGTYTVHWMVNGSEVCTGDELTLEGPCSVAAEALMEGAEIEVIVVDQSGCEFATQFAWIPSSVTEHNQSFHVWPNPAYETVYVAGFQDQETATLHTLTGQLVATQKLIADAATSRIDISFLPTGVYLLRVGSKCTHILIRR